MNSDALAALYPSMTPDAQAKTETVQGGWLDQFAKELKSADSDEQKVVDKAPEAAQPTPEQVKATIEGVAKEMGFAPSEFPEGISEFADKPEKLKSLVEMYNKQVTKMVDAQPAKWREQSETEFKSQPDAIPAAKKALARYDEGGEFGNFLEHSGLGNHPAIIRFLSKIGKSQR